MLLETGSSNAQLYYKAKTVTTREGLSDNRVTCFHKDRKGFMWIGTRNGLNRYDGHSFKVFRPMQSNSISNEVINDIAEDSRGRIWVATMEGLNIYTPDKNRWDHILPNPDSFKLSIPNYIVWDIMIDRNDLVWIACDVFAFSSYDIKTEKFVFYDWPSFQRSLPEFTWARYKSIQQFVQKSENEYWLGTTIGLVKLNISTKQFSFIGHDYYGDVTDMRYDAAAGKVFVSKERGKHYVYDEKKNVYSEITVVKEPYPSARLGRQQHNDLWMASEAGLLKINDDREEVHLETNIPQLSGSLLPGGVLSVFEDDQHLRWVATPNGISVYDPVAFSSAFLPLLPVSDKEGSNGMGGVYYDELSERYFVCSADPACVFIADAGTGEIRRVSTDERGNPLTGCITVKRDNENNIWLLTNCNIYRYNRQTGKFSLFTAPNNGEEVLFRDMLQDREGNYWFATFHKGIYYYGAKEKRFLPLKDSAISKISSATGLVQDVSGHIIIGTFGLGVYVYNPATGKAEGYYPTNKTKDYSQIQLINSVGKDDKGGVWLSTFSGGLYRYNTEMPFESTFSRFDMRSGLSNNNILSVCGDGDSALWLLSGNSIFALSSKGKFLYNLSEAELFNFSTYSSDSRFGHQIYFNPKKSELLVGVSGGLFIYSPAAKTRRIKFPVTITSVKVNGKIVADSLVNNSSSYQLPFSSNAVSFDFAGLYYGSVPVQYEYKLEGYDEGWVNVQGSFSATYQNLPPGNYLFKVRAKDEQENIAGEVSAFPFRIVPPFWRRWWFVLLAFLLSAAMIYWFIYSLLQKLKAERTINSFATSLYGQNTTDDIFWDTAKNCIEKIGFTDCVIYQKDENRDVLIQKAAYGPKNPYRREILNSIEIPVGKGIVGSVAKHGRAVIIHDTSKDLRYIVDDEKRLSEIAVPILVDGKVFAVIDSENSQKGYFTRYHLRVLKKIAAICGERITKYLTEEKLRTKIARDLHDEMGSTLTSINIISKVAMEEGQEQEKTKQYFQKIKDHSGRMMESMSDMVWAINPVNDSFEKVILRMKEFAAEILEPARINYYFTETGELEKTQLNPEQRKDIYLIFKEALNNVVKYSAATEVNISFELTVDRLRMMIADNGSGFDATVISSGNGLKNMHSRSAEMGATIRIDSIKGTGTLIALELPVT